MRITRPYFHSYSRIRWIRIFILVSVSFLTISNVRGQSCPTSCPIPNNCSASYGPPRCHGPGDYPSCQESQPDPCKYPGNGCSSTESLSDGCCIQATSPIIIDLNATGFSLSDPRGGVLYKFFPYTDTLYHVSWPTLGSSNVWLVLDRNGNGLIDDFSEFFGNLTPQPDPPPGLSRNGFLALAVYDKPEEGGNGDNQISEADKVYSKLGVWKDVNHDGISQPNELLTLDEVGIKSIALSYRLVNRTDEYGNIYRYGGTIQDQDGGIASKIIYDVFVELQALPTTIAREQSSRRESFAILFK